LTIRRILSDSAKFETLKSFAAAGEALAGDNSTIVCIGEVHKAKRKLMSGGFAPPQLRQATKKLENLIQILASKIDGMVERKEGKK
jgi:cytochrome P450